MNVLLLGGSGFIGQNMKIYFKEKCELDVPTHAQLDVLDEISVRKCLKEKKYNIVLNCLDDNGDEKDYFENRLRMFMNLYKYNDLYGKMIYFGSGAEYNRFRDVVNVSEDMVDKAFPHDTYGFCLNHMNFLTKNSDNIYNLRLFGIYGEHEIWEKRFISNAICKVLCGYPITIRQDRKMDYLYIGDLCKMTEWIMNNNPKRHDYNAVSGKGKYLSEIAREINQTLRTNVPIYIAKEGVAKQYTASADAILSEMGKFCYIDFGESLKKLCDYYRENFDAICREKLLYQ